MLDGRQIEYGRASSMFLYFALFSITLCPGGLEGATPSHLDKGKSLFEGTCSDSVAATEEGKREALKELQAAVVSDPQSAEAHHYLARIYLCLAAGKKGGEEFEEYQSEALDELKLAVRLDPNNPIIHFDLAGALGQDRQGAIKELRTAVQLFEKMPKRQLDTVSSGYADYYSESVWVLGRALSEKSTTLQEGITLMEKSISLTRGPDDSNDRKRRLADILAYRGRYGEALKWYETLPHTPETDEKMSEMRKKANKQY